MKNILCLLTVCCIGASSLQAKTYWYDIDYAKSQIGFLAKSRVLNATGTFRKWSFKGKIAANLHVVGDIVIDCKSIDTDNERRDKHLTSGDFFDCDKYPQHVFRIQKVQGDQATLAKASRFDVVGDLTMHGVTQNVTLQLKRDGLEDKFTLVGSLIINRDKFGISYDSALNPIEKDVRIDITLHLKRRTEKANYGGS